MTAKTPFEVRLDVMKMAQEMLDREYTAQEQVFLAQVTSLQAEKGMPASRVTEQIAHLAPKRYGPDDVITRATQLYSFVNNKH